MRRARPRPSAARVVALGVTAAVLVASCGDPSATAEPVASSASPSTSSPAPAVSSPALETEQPTERATEAPASDAPGTAGSSAPGAGGVGGGEGVTLLFTGEVLMHNSLIQQALQNGGGRNFDFRPMFDEIRDLVSGADLAVCHLELPVIPDGEGMEPRYATPPQVVDALADAGFDRCSTASNHALDRGAKGSDATLAALERVGMTQAGTASSAAGQVPQVLDVGGFKVAHLSYTEVGGRPIPAGQPWRMAMASKSRIVADVRKARALGAEYVAVSIHDADELAYTPTGNQTKWDEWLAENADVDLVIGTGSHVPEPEENDNGAFVLFGLGNLINWRLDARDSVIAQVRLTRDGDGGVVAAEPTLIPTFTDEPLGYQILDVREHATARYEGRVKADLTRSWNRIKRYVAEYVEPLAG